MIIKRGFLMLLMILPSVCLAQNAGVGIQLQMEHYPDFRLNRQSIGSTSPFSVGVRGYDLNLAPVEYGFHFTVGYGSDVSFAYGVSVALLTTSNKSNLFKAGFRLDRIQMRHYRSDVFVGGIREDEVHDSAQPYIEWEYRVTNLLSVNLNIGYRFVRSDTEYLTKLIDQHELPGGGMIYQFNARHKQHYYGAGVQVGAGLRIYFD